MGKQQRQDRARRILRQLLIGLLLAIAALTLVYSAFRRWTTFSMPADDSPPHTARVRVEKEGDDIRIALGRSWLGSMGRLRTISLEGDARELGIAHGMLLQRAVVRMDKQLHDQIMRSAPKGIRRRWWLDLHAFRLRNLPEAIAPRRIAEMAGIARHMPSDDSLARTPYQRLLFYHAAFDAVHDQGLPASESVLLAAWGDQTVGGSLLAARSFSMRGAQAYEQERLLFLVRGTGGIAFAALGWPGLVGFNTGINAERIFVALAPARSDEGLAAGSPSLLLTRRVLEEAKSIDEALKLLKKAPRKGSFSLLIADGKAGKAAVIEATPKRVWLRQAEGKRLTACDHLTHVKFKADAANDWVRRYTASGAHQARAKQLLSRFAGRIDAAALALILRNRTGLRDTPLALGHGAAIDALRANQALVADVTNLVLWINTGPGVLGEFSPLDLKPLFGEPTTPPLPKPIAADGLLQSAEYARYRLARDEIAFATELRQRHALRAAVDHAQRAVEAAPDLPLARRLLADLHWELGDREQARHHYKRFLELKPALRGEVEQVERLLQQ